jgi:hypothetical protein
MRIVLFLTVLVLSQVASARVYMCVDHSTGKTSFTDMACDAQGSREEVKVDAANLDSGQRYGKAPSRQKTWNSERDTRKSGLDYQVPSADLYKDGATAQAN